MNINYHYPFLVPLGVLMEKYETKFEDDEIPNSKNKKMNIDNDNFFDDSGNLL